MPQRAVLRSSAALFASAVLLFAFASRCSAQGPANPLAIPGSRGEAINPGGNRPGTQEVVRQATNYPLLYLLWRNNTIGERGFGLNVRRQNSTSRDFPDQAAFNTSFIQLDSGVQPAVSITNQVALIRTFNNTNIPALVQAGSANRNQYNSTTQQVITAGDNQATAIARGTFNNNNKRKLPPTPPSPPRPPSPPPRPPSPPSPPGPPPPRPPSPSPPTPPRPPSPPPTPPPPPKDNKTDKKPIAPVDAKYKDIATVVKDATSAQGVSKSETPLSALLNPMRANEPVIRVTEGGLAGRRLRGDHASVVVTHARGMGVRRMLHKGDKGGM